MRAVTRLAGAVLLTALLTTSPALADPGSDAKTFRAAQSATMQALVTKLKADDGGKYDTLSKEVAAFRASHKAASSARRVSTLSTRELDAAVGQLRRRAEDKRIQATSATHLYGFAADDVFNHAKVLEAFSKMPVANLYRLPKIQMIQGVRSRKKGALARLVMAGPPTTVRRAATLKQPEASWFKGSIHTTLPYVQAPAEGTVVMLWQAKVNTWRVVTASGEVFGLRKLKAEQQGAKSGVWAHSSPSFVTPSAARVLADLGALDKKVAARLNKASLAMWKCNASVIKKANKRRKAVNKAKLMSSVRAKKLKAIRVASYDSLDKKCGKKKAAYNKALVATAADLSRARQALAKRVHALRAK